MTMPDPIDLSKLTEEEGRLYSIARKQEAFVKRGEAAPMFDVSYGALDLLLTTIISERTLRETADKAADKWAAKWLVEQSQTRILKTALETAERERDEARKTASKLFIEHLPVLTRAVSAEAQLALCREALEFQAVKAVYPPPSRDGTFGPIGAECELCGSYTASHRESVQHKPDCILSTKGEDRG